MEKFNFSKDQKLLGKWLVGRILQQLKKNNPKRKKIPSIIIHVIAYKVIKNCDLPLPIGWYIEGPYVLIVDDILVEYGFMPAEKHQLYGEK